MNKIKQFRLRPLLCLGLGLVLGGGLFFSGLGFTALSDIQPRLPHPTTTAEDLIALRNKPVQLKEYMRQIEGSGSKEMSVRSIHPGLDFGRPPAEPQIGEGADGSFAASVSDGYTRVEAVAIQPDGKIIAGGTLPLANGVARTCIARFNSDGTLDAAFNVTLLGACSVLDIVVQPNGKILISGGPSGIMRVNSDGSSDATFQTGTGAVGGVNDILLLSNGKIIISGNLSSYNGTTISRLAQLNADGSLDTSFVPPTINSSIQQAAVQSDGKVLIVGGFSSVGGLGRIATARLNTDGSHDTSYVPGNNTNGGGGPRGSIFVQSDGKILVGTSSVGLVRLDSSGALDPSFTPSFNNMSGDGSIHSIAVLGDGKIVTGGAEFESNGVYFAVSKFNADGTRDLTFTRPQSIRGGIEVFSIALDPTNKIVAVGDVYKLGSDSTPSKHIARLNVDGTIDPGFNCSIEGFGTAYSIVQQADGKILVGGNFEAVNGLPRRNIARFNSNGSLDLGFNANLELYMVRKIVLQSDGKLLVGGERGYANVQPLFRLNSDGTMDTSFAITNPDMTIQWALSIEIQPDDKIVMGGNILTQTGSLGLHRFNSNGTSDLSLSVPNFSAVVYELSLLPGGQMYVGGSFVNYGGSGRNKLVRLNSDGSVDNSFNTGTGPNFTVFALARQPDGKILIGGDFVTVNGVANPRIARLNNAGSLDASFISGTGFDSTVVDIEIQPDGFGGFPFLAGGTFFNYNGLPRPRLVKIDENGSYLFNEGISGASIRDIAFQSDGKPLIAGSFSSVGGQVHASVARLSVNPNDECITTPILIGQSASSSLSNISCLVNSDGTALYTFPGSAGQQVAISMEALQFFSKLELLNPSEVVIATAGGVNGVNNARIPASGFFTLPVTGTYTIRAIAAFGGAGNYTLSLIEQPVQTCTYSLSPGFVDVPSGGGSFFFDVLTQQGCPSTASPPASGTIYSGLTYVGGRVRFNVGTNTGSFRSEMIPIAGTNFTINQCGAGPPGNDNFANAAVITGASGIHTDITSNSVATAEAGEPTHAGNTSAKSVWYSWTAPASGLYSFSTSGSNFDTVMAVYVCPATGDCTFANMTQVGSNDDTTSFDVTSKVNFRADMGRVYRIAVDGKNGASGNVELSWRQYRRLFRLYLQTYNGTQSPIVPDTITASNGTATQTPVIVSLGVYEFDLPADNTVYNVTITGPTGIVWDPNGFPLDTSFSELDELMFGAGSGPQNTVSNAQFQLPQSVFGFIRNITAPEVPDLSVTMSSSRGPNPRPPAPCTEIVPVTDPPGGYVRYRCTAQPNSLHDIIPTMPGKVFTSPLRAFEQPIISTIVATTSTAMIAAGVPTYSLAGNVTAGGVGTQVDLRYTPEVNGPEITLRTATNASGGYTFPNLPGGTFQINARSMGLVFGAPQSVTLPGGAGPVNIAPQVVCVYTPGSLAALPFAGGVGQFNVAVNHPACEWRATTNATWIVINSGATVGAGPVHVTLQDNPGIARAGLVVVGGRAIQIQQEGGTPATGIEADLTPRSGPDGVILSSDVTQMRRFATGLDTFNGAVNEGQRADCAPSATLGDGAITATDIVQVRRYAAGLDPATNAGGPAIALSRPVTVFAADPAIGSNVEALLFRREVRAGTATAFSGGSVTVPLEMTALRNESAASFTLEYDPSMLANPRVELADGAPAGSILTVNTNIKGRIGILFEAPGTLSASPTHQRILSVTFDTAPAANGTTRLQITGSLAQKGISDTLGNTLTAEYLDGYIVFGSEMLWR